MIDKGFFERHGDDDCSRDAVDTSGKTLVELGRGLKSIGSDAGTATSAFRSKWALAVVEVRVR
ncbi:hypothetical protein HZZ13_15835 [Bradyrhizobium sp. CNPSo 4010]|uniref:Uncharacterized protein n=1 Tax=Bradyrhizobium agreste TaxID=2751811 RepID=A0ABS0PPX9_9BRAD|nr:hypothetical protein [Bradyrhizobium agreste]MBH5399237.1 hypothetical protein [Bradyrhizobium agreste]